MKVRLLIIGMLLVSLAIGRSAFAQNEERYECTRLMPNGEKHDQLKDLFRYAQIAERPKHPDNHYMKNCNLPTGVPLVHAPRNIEPLRMTDRLEHEIEAAFEQEGLTRASLELLADGDGGISIRCRPGDGSEALSLSSGITHILY